MTEDEGREDREDLFEDLDKFFAPIQDVDWPEPSEPVAATPETPSSEQTAPVEPLEAGEPEVEEPEAPSERPATEALFAEPSATEQSSRTEEEDEEEEEEQGGGVEAFLFAEEEEEEGEGVDIGAAISSERERTPEAYLDLPGGPQDDLGAVAEPIEEPEEIPSEEDVEAAAEHFAASVREEVGEPVTQGFDTEPDAGIEELLAPYDREWPCGRPGHPGHRVRCGRRRPPRGRLRRRDGAPRGGGAGGSGSHRPRRRGRPRRAELAGAHDGRGRPRRRAADPRP